VSIPRPAPPATLADSRGCSSVGSSVSRDLSLEVPGPEPFDRRWLMRRLKLLERWSFVDPPPGRFASHCTWWNAEAHRDSWLRSPEGFLICMVCHPPAEVLV
jgi:hypothetical protein